ncbi:MAG: phosphoenolpyruvate carboxykinase, partial [Pseudonocardiales bacterium]|nr:phosphoenolpyruvate carboxykinase [Pseudonocardiales bacterium]
MTSTVLRLDTAPTDHLGLLRWVRDTAELTEPDEVVWCDGSAEEWRRLTEQLVAAGTLTRLDDAKKPNSFYCASDPSD